MRFIKVFNIADTQVAVFKEWSEDQGHTVKLFTNVVNPPGQKKRPFATYIGTQRCDSEAMQQVMFDKIEEKECAEFLNKMEIQERRNASGLVLPFNGR